MAVLQVRLFSVFYLQSPLIFVISLWEDTKFDSHAKPEIVLASCPIHFSSKVWRFLGAFAKLLKATVSFFMSGLPSLRLPVRPSARVEHLGSFTHIYGFPCKI
jgi:hypothetical protein